MPLAGRQCRSPPHHALPGTGYTTRTPDLPSPTHPLFLGLATAALGHVFCASLFPEARSRQRRRRHVRGTLGPVTGERDRGERDAGPQPGKGYTLRRCPMSWMRLAACWRCDSSSSASTPQRRLGVFSSCSRVKNQREEAPRPDAMTLPPPPAPLARPLPSGLGDSAPRPRGPAPMRSP